MHLAHWRLIWQVLQKKLRKLSFLVVPRYSSLRAIRLVEDIPSADAGQAFEFWKAFDEVSQHLALPIPKLKIIILDTDLRNRAALF